MTEKPPTTVEVRLEDAMRFTGIGEDGVTVLMDSDSNHGGTGSGFRPMELLLTGLGGCMGMDVISILRKKRQDVTAYRIEISGTQADNYPRVFTEISMRHIVHGNDVSEDAVARAIELSATKYCPAWAMLAKAADLTTDYDIRPASPAD